MSTVSLIRVEDDLYTAVAGAMEEFGGVVGRGDRVLIKPNLVEPRSPDSGEITHPRLIEAVARYCLDCGASKVIIGEGPSYYQPESNLPECFTRTGVSEVAKRLGIPWVLFDEHGYRTFRDVSAYTPKSFRVTEFAFNCDKLINLPVLKTHYQATVTLAMKNLKGCLKREDKPLFHRRDLSCAVVELNKIVKPSFNIIDATVGKRASTPLLIAGRDVVAVDAVGCALMGIEPEEVRTVTLGAAAGLGEKDIARLDIRGEDLKLLKFKVEGPRGQLRRSFPLLEIAGAERACSGCLIPLLSALFSLREVGKRLERPLTIVLGRDSQPPLGETCVLLGDCACIDGAESVVGGCPPSRQELLESLGAYFTS